MNCKIKLECTDNHLAAEAAGSTMDMLTALTSLTASFYQCDEMLQELSFEEYLEVLVDMVKHAYKHNDIEGEILYGGN